jgi:hypothetical protein
MKLRRDVRLGPRQSLKGCHVLSILLIRKLLARISDCAKVYETIIWSENVRIISKEGLLLLQAVQEDVQNSGT